MKKVHYFWTIFFILSLIPGLLSVKALIIAEGDPYFYSFYDLTYDSDEDGIDDGVKARFDPDFPENNSGMVTVHVILFSYNDTLISNVSDTYYLLGDFYDYLELDLGTQPAGLYYLVGEIFFNSTKTDTRTTSLFRLGLLPYFYSFNYLTFDSDEDGVDDGVKAVFDPDVPSGQVDKVTVHAALFSSNNTLINNASDTFSLTGTIYDYFKLDLGVNLTGLYYLVGEIFLNSIMTDNETTSLFRLGLQPYFYSFDYLTYDSDGDGLEDGVKAVFDPDVPSGYSGSITVYVDLYDSSNRTLIATASESYYLYGTSADYLTLDLGPVGSAGFYYLLGEIFFGSISADTMTTSSFYLSAGEIPIIDKLAPTNQSDLPYKQKTGHKRGDPIDNPPTASETPSFESVVGIIGLGCLTIMRQLHRKAKD
jgi:hypothetical protein